MMLPSKPLLIAGLGVLSAVGLVSAWRLRQASQEPDQQQALREVDQQLLEGTAGRAVQPGGRPQGSASPQDLSSQLVILNADEYRQEIGDLDRLIFEEQPLTKERRGLLAKKLEELAQRITSGSDSRFLAIEAYEIKQLAAIASNLRPDARCTTLQNQWMRIRNNLFDDRSWFARSAADLEPGLGATASTGDPFGSPDASKGAADPFVSVAAAPAQANQELEGRWRVKALFGNGRPTTDPELTNSLWMFDRNHLFIAGRTGSPSHYTFSAVSDERGTALHLEPDPSNAGPTEEGWMNYEFAGGELRLAFYDGLGERPEGFAPPAGKREPLLTMVVLYRER